MKFRIGTRESALALAQTEIIVNLIKNKVPTAQIEIIKIKTTGDKILDKTLDKVGGKGLFIKELESALLDNQIDIAVHSLKDIPVSLAEGLCLACFSHRENPFDSIISRYPSLTAIKANAVIGTSSTRREIQIRTLLPQSTILPLRGNVLTRIDKLKQNQFDAIILAKSGLLRLSINDLEGFHIITLDKSQMVPAIGQGILCVETRLDSPINSILSQINCPSSELIANCERAVMKALGGNCFTPLSCFCEIKNNKIFASGFLASQDKSLFVKDCLESDLPDNYDSSLPLTNQILELTHNLGVNLANSLTYKLNTLRRNVK